MTEPSMGDRDFMFRHEPYPIDEWAEKWISALDWLFGYKPSDAPEQLEEPEDEAV